MRARSLLVFFPFLLPGCLGGGLPQCMPGQGLVSGADGWVCASADAPEPPSFEDVDLAETVDQQGGQLVVQEFQLASHTERLIEHGDRLDGHDVRLDGHDVRFDGHDVRFDEHDIRLSDQDGRLTGHDVRLDEQGTRLDTNDVRLDTNDARIDTNDVRLDDHDVRFDDVDDELDQQSELIEGIVDDLPDALQNPHRINVFDFISPALHPAITDCSNTVDLAPDIQAAVDAAKVDPTAQSSAWLPVDFPPGCFRIESPIEANGSGADGFTGASLYGSGFGTVIDNSAFADKHGAFVYLGGSGGQSGAIVSGFHFLGNPTAVGVELRGQGGVTIRDSQFTNLAVGVWFHNEIGRGSWTEFNVAENCTFNLSCEAAVEYSTDAPVNSPSTSFHGSGIRNSTIVTDGGAVVVGANANVYNAPLSATIFSLAPQPVIIDHDPGDSYEPKFHGNLRLEIPTPGYGTVLAQGLTYFAGTLDVLDHHFTPGDFVQTVRTVSNSNGSETVSFLPRTGVVERTPWQPTWIPMLDGGSPQGQLVKVRFMNKPSYGAFEYRAWVAVFHNGMGGPGHAELLAEYSIIDLGGRPIFSVEPDGSLKVDFASNGTAMDIAWTVAALE